MISQREPLKWLTRISLRARIQLSLQSLRTSLLCFPDMQTCSLLDKNNLRFLLLARRANSLITKNLHVRSSKMVSAILLLILANSILHLGLI